MKPFNLEAFKAGQKACLIEGKWFRYEFTTSEGRICVEYEAALPLCDKVQVYHLETLKKAHMVSRHQSLIDAYNPDDTWQFSIKTYDKWFDIEGKPEWEEDREFRIHPHNDLIKAWKKGAKIEAYIVGDWVEEPNPDWYEDTKYRIKPSTKTVYEYIVKNDFGTWILHTALIEEDEAEDYFKQFKGFVKTGRSWEVEV